MTSPAPPTSNDSIVPRRSVLSWVANAIHWHTRHGLMWTGVAALSIAIVLVSQTKLRLAAEEMLLGWLQERQDERLTHNDLAPEGDLSVADRVTTVLVHQLPKAQASLAQWIARQYRVAPDAIAPLVAEAFTLSEQTAIDPTVILAVMAVESRFNPFAQSAVGAQGLMQVLTRVHTDKYEVYGGRMAAFDPLTNLRVGVQVLQDCVKRAGSVDGGLRLYVGAVSTSGQFYVDKVYATQRQMARVIGGTPLYSQSKASEDTASPVKPEAPAPARAPA